jgi:MYXO-CTERM domain-containing protein
MITRLLAGILGLVLFSGSTSAMLLGTSIDARLESVSVNSAVGIQFITPATIVDPGVEFSGAMRLGGSGDPTDPLFGIILDFDDTSLTITPQQLSPVSGIGGDFGLIVVRLFNISPSIIGVTETFASGGTTQVLFTPSISEIQIVFSYWNTNLLHRFEFDFAPVPEPGPMTFLLFGLAVLGVMRRRRTGGSL